MGVVRVTRRGQLVLVAAAVAALALVPVAAAYLQFGYAPDVADPDADHGERVASELDRLVDDAAERATGRPWSEREAAVRELRAALGPPVDTLERSRLGDAVAVHVTENESAVAGVACPSGRGRAFGDCERDGGVVLQERANETVVVAVALDVRVTTPDGTTTFTRVLQPR
ncbi:DUF7261 family protein [Halobacterium jilantaiense]|uniref:Uncharacterized protein n=1 Tax=Halobacterium jilantaiense TaxID=355548 RepID=A0A1I0P290_9EURY|nr:hypothetical protein [Halobacterium jilantaiense]SEW08099.1 hypothetical protein SAMN04487945_1328 [Halobacterium jilantaiense]